MRHQHNDDLTKYILLKISPLLATREDLPTDLTLNLDLHKITPFPMTVPCLNGVGSCEYEVLLQFLADICHLDRIRDRWPHLLSDILSPKSSKSFKLGMFHFLKQRTLFSLFNLV